MTVSDFEVVSVGTLSLCYLNYQDEASARGGDPFTLYPSWYVPLGFDDVYPGFVTGAYVRVWADSGEVAEIGPLIYGDGGFAEDNISGQVQEQTLVPMIVTVSLIAIFITGFHFGSSKKRLLWIGLLKKRSAKLSATLPCVIALFSLIIIMVPQAKAADSSGTWASAIYGSTYHQFPDNGTVNEIGAISQICDSLESKFSNAGYDYVINAFDEGTTESNVLNNAYNMDRDYDNVAVFIAAHGGISTYLDSNNETIYSSDIEEETNGNTIFAFSWTCFSTHSHTSGLSVAWTQDTGLSSNGYDSPSGTHCYIGFYNASPALSAGSFRYSSVCGQSWVTNFYYQLVTRGYTVNDALDQASWTFFEVPFDETPLYEGYDTWWPDREWPDSESYGWHYGKMNVFGNGNIKLQQRSELKFDARVWYPEWQEWVPIDVGVYIDDEYVGSTGYMYLETAVTPGIHEIEVDEEWFYNPFVGFWLEPDYYGNNPYEYQPITVYATSEGIYFQVAYGYPP